MNETFTIYKKEDIVKFINSFIKLNDDDIFKRNQNILLMEKEIHKIWKDSNVTLFGSFQQELSHKYSDIDLCVHTKNNEPPTWNDIEYFMEIMELIYRKECEFIRTAKIPLIVVHDTIWNITIDISFSYYNNHIDNAFKLSKDIKSYANSYGNYFKNIVLFVKFLVFSYGLNKNTIYCNNNGKRLNSISIIFMVIYYLENVKKTKNKNNELSNKIIMDLIVDDNFFCDLLNFFYGYIFLNYDIFITLSSKYNNNIYEIVNNIKNDNYFEKENKNEKNDNNLSSCNIIFQYAYYSLNEILYGVDNNNNVTT